MRRRQPRGLGLGLNLAFRYPAKEEQFQFQLTVAAISGNAGMDLASPAGSIDPPALADGRTIRSCASYGPNWGVCGLTNQDISTTGKVYISFPSLGASGILSSFDGTSFRYGGVIDDLQALTVAQIGNIIPVTVVWDYTG